MPLPISSNYKRIRGKLILGEQSDECRAPLLHEFAWRSFAVDDVYRINVAKTEFRDAYNSGDVERLLAVTHENFVDMSDGSRCGFGAPGRAAFRERISVLFEKYSVNLVPIVLEIVPAGEIMFDYGWHEFTLTPKAGGEVIQKRDRIFELWRRNSAGEWKIQYLMSNADVANVVNGQVARWFRSADLGGEAVPR